MKSIAEYFRDLAAEDRYFGAEPPTPDISMLQQIAEREIHRRVIGREADGGVVLSPAAPEEEETKAAESAPETAPAATAPTAAPEAPTTAEAPPARVETVAEKLARIRSVTGTAGIAPPPAEEEYLEDAEEEEAAIATAEAAAFADHFEAPTEEAEAETAEAPEEVAEAPEEEAEAEASAEPMAAAAFEGAIAEAEMIEPSEAQAPIVEEAAPAEAEAAEAEAEAETAPEAEAAMAEEEVAVEAVAEAMHEEVAEAAEAAEEKMVAEAFDEEEEEDLLEAESLAAEMEGAETEEDVERLLSALYTEPAITPSGPAAATETEEVEEPEAAILMPAPEAIPAEEAVKEAVEEFKTAEAEVPEFGEPEFAEPEVAMVEAAEPQEAPIVLPPEAAVAPAAEPAETSAEAEEIPETPGPLRLDNIGGMVERARLAARRARARIRSVTDTMEAEHLGEFAEEEGPEPPAPTARAPRGDILKGTPVAGDEEAAFARLIETTNSRIVVDGAHRKRENITHLKTAVIATEAEKEAGGGLGPEADFHEFRRDLEKAIGPEKAPAPLVLVSEQRVDRAAEQPAGPVRPRRVAKGNLALNEEDEEEYEAHIEGEPAQSFASFVEAMGARDVADLIEAAAAYAMTVEGRARFTRPHIMRTVGAYLDDGGDSRAEGLRAFGTLLREGKMRRVAAGRFRLTHRSRFAKLLEEQGED